MPDETPSKLSAVVNNAVVLLLVRACVVVGIPFAGWQLNHAYASFDALSVKVDNLGQDSATTKAMLASHQRQLDWHQEWLTRLDPMLPRRERQ